MKNDDEEKQYPTQAQDTQKKNLRTKQLLFFAQISLCKRCVCFLTGGVWLLSILH